MLFQQQGRFREFPRNKPRDHARIHSASGQDLLHPHPKALLESASAPADHDPLLARDEASFGCHL